MILSLLILNYVRDFLRVKDLIVMEKRIHTVSVSGLLETSADIPNLDYLQLLKLTKIITKDKNEVYKMYRLMCFNVYAHNLDDHSKNFSFVYKNNRYVLSPAYDLTYNNANNFEHATTINYKGNPDEVYNRVNIDLKKYKNKYKF